MAQRNQRLESIASSVELTLASVLQGIPLALLVPRMVDLLLSGDLARLLYAPASLLLVFIIWTMFVLHALSVITWPFDPWHNLLYFGIVVAEAVLLSLIEQPAMWFIALCGLGVMLVLNSRYNQQLLLRQRDRLISSAEQNLAAHVQQEQRQVQRYAFFYIGVGLLGGMLVPWLTDRIPAATAWMAAAVGAVVLPLVHVRWLAQLIPARSAYIEAALSEP